MPTSGITCILMEFENGGITIFDILNTAVFWQCQNDGWHLSREGHGKAVKKHGNNELNVKYYTPGFNFATVQEIYTSFS